MPDEVYARSAMAAVEERIGLRPIEELLAERLALIEQAADLRARHGSFGTFDASRKVQLATIKMTLRARGQRDGVKLTEAALEDGAHADPVYMEFVIQGTQERARLTMIEAQIEAIDATIQRGNAVTRFAASEMRL